MRIYSAILVFIPGGLPDGVGYRITSDKFTKFLENAAGAAHPLFLLYRVDTRKRPSFMTE